MSGDGTFLVTLSFPDLIILVGYFAVVLVVGFARRGKAANDTVQFLLAGRSLTTPVFVMTLVSTWYGGILGVGEFSYLYGISNWVVQGVPYYIFAGLFAFLLAGKVRASNLLTIPDKLQSAYDRRTGILGAVLTFLLMTPAPYILMLAILLEVVTGWSMLLCLVLGTTAATAYLWTGGFRADVRTDIVEFFAMFLGFAVILPYAFGKFGGFEFIAAHVPPLHLRWDGGNSAQFVIVWFFIALWTLVDPSFHQRCYAARSGSVARNGILLSILFWLCFDAMTATAGLYARAALPGLRQPMMAFPLLAEVTLPPGVKGLFFVGMLATIMSTLNTLAFVSAATLGRDIVWRSTSGRIGLSETALTRIGLLVSALLSIVLALLIPSVVKLWYVIGTAIVPGLLIPLVTAYFEPLRVAPRFAFVAMLLAWLTSLAWMILGWSQGLAATAGYPLGIEPMYPGLLAGLMVWGCGMIRKWQGHDVAAVPGALQNPGEATKA
jgi:SSS family solute:Na+ symporter